MPEATKTALSYHAKHLCILSVIPPAKKEKIFCINISINEMLLLFIYKTYYIQYHRYLQL